MNAPRFSAHPGHRPSDTTPAPAAIVELQMKSLYLVRIDDVCPTMNWEVWDAIEPLLVKNGIKPIMAVIPDNQDQKLMVGAPCPDFWDRVRHWQSLGWTIALHGHQHLYLSRQRGLVGRRALSEFAGLSQVEQRRKLVAAAEIMRAEKINPLVWAAPGHSFDAETVKLLPELGIRIISDGYWRWPRRDGDDIFWIPQQLSSFCTAPPGVWTVCCHFNKWRETEIARFGQHLRHFRKKIVSLEEIQNFFGNRPGGVWERYMYYGPLNYWLMRARLVLCGEILTRPDPPPDVKGEDGESRG